LKTFGHCHSPVPAENKIAENIAGYWQANENSRVTTFMASPPGFYLSQPLQKLS
jgi:hypothetical protein